ncbi:Aste57867_18138 [Aphanomyces stellatus]|uniref:Aste57867_18138 protein n=1 Tax=Aphanomyces stellatus TaxID=120398 RepID=A0A485L9B5_9STRA|nr:hypothetical protein As57867_018076 [Aphanomyces stellatus]VFT94876.1 Aste57867_18138 [Aphanomyces stellatus]
MAAKTHDELVKAVTDGDVLQVLLAELSGDTCDVNALYVFKDKKGNDWKAPPLVVAAYMGHTELVQSFVDRADIDVNGIDDEEKTALMVAATENRLDAVKSLLANDKIQVNRVDDYGETALFKAAEKGKIPVVRELLAYPGIQVHIANKGDQTPLMVAAENGHVNTLKLFLDRPEDAPEVKHPALYAACVGGKPKVVDMLLNERNDMDINYVNSDGDTPLIAAAEDGNVDTVRLLLAHPDVHVDVQGSAQQTALTKAAMYGYLEVVDLLLAAGADTSLVDKNDDTCLDIAIKDENYAVAVALLATGMPLSNIHHQDKLVLEWVAPHLTDDVALALLRLDLPCVVDANGGTVATREDHSFSWTTFLDSHVPVDSALRVRVVQTLLASASDDLVREFAYAKDQHGRAALQVTDAATRDVLNGLLFFCGRYELFDGPAIHVSATAVVVHAYDHGVFRQVFREFADDESGQLDKAGFQACGRILGTTVSSESSKQQKVVVDDGAEFDLWDKDNSGWLSEAEYLRYCDQLYGGKLKVAMKFMRHQDEYAREVATRTGLDTQFVLGLLPMLPQQTVHDHVQTLTLHDLPMSKYPNVLVMPAADRSLEDIFLKERPNDNQIRSMLHEVAEGLAHLHSHGIVHGDLKKLNVLRVRHHMRLIDMDAATPMGQPIGAKFSSGSLPPELFHKLQSDDECAQYTAYWTNACDPDTWAKVQPRSGYVVKTFHSDDVAAPETLPYKRVRASPAIDVWAFGALMYQMYSGVELVPTDVNQDVVDDDGGIQRAATWTPDDLSTRIANKVSNPLARDLVSKLLVVDPESRMSVKAMLAHPYFHVQFNVDSAAVLAKLDTLSNQVTSGFQSLEARLDDVIELNKETLKALGQAKQDLMRGIFEATEVAIPTSFVLLPVNLATARRNDDDDDNGDDDPEDTFETITKFLHDDVLDMGRSFMQALQDNKPIGRALKIVAPGQPLFLYLIDEVKGEPVVPTTPNSIYPIRIDTKSPDYMQFMSAAMPYIQTGIRLLQGVQTISRFAACLGLPVDTSLVRTARSKLEHATKTSSVFDFDLVQSAVETQQESGHGAPVQHIRGAALRELERFFRAFDKDKDYAGLCRTYAANGQALWTTKGTIETLAQTQQTATAAKPVAATSKAKTGSQVYAQMLAGYERSDGHIDTATEMRESSPPRNVPPMPPRAKTEKELPAHPPCCAFM